MAISEGAIYQRFDRSRNVVNTHVLLHDSYARVGGYAGYLGATSDQITKAMQKAVDKTARWLRALMIREMAAATGIPQKAFKRGLQVSHSRKGSNQAKDRVNAVLYVLRKFLTVPASELGRARQTRTGVRVGKWSFRHAFIATMPQVGRPRVYIREGYDTGYPEPRLPVKEVGLKLPEVYEEAFAKVVEGQAVEYFERTMLHEVKYALGLVGR